MPASNVGDVGTPLASASSSRAPAHRLRHLRRPVVQRLRVQHDEDVKLPCIGQLARMEDRTLERVRPGTPTTCDHVRLAQEPPRLREPEMIVDLLQLRDDRLSHPPVLLGGAGRLRVRALPLQLDRRPKLRPPVAVVRRGRDRLLEQRAGAIPLARPHRGAPQLGQERAPAPVVLRQQRERPLEHHDCGGQVLPRKRPSSRGRQEAAGLDRQRRRFVVVPGRAPCGSGGPARGGSR